MKPNEKNDRSGGIAVALLLLTMLVPVILGSYASVSMSNFRTTQKALRYMRSRIIAQDALLATASRFYQLLVENPGASSSLLQTRLSSDASSKIPNHVLNTSDKNLGFVVDKIDVSVLKPNSITNIVFISVAASHASTDGKYALSARYLVSAESFAKYAIFSDGRLEFHAGPTMHIYGRVRSNSLTEFWPVSGVYLHDPLIVAGNVDVIKGTRKSEMFCAERSHLAVNGSRLTKNFTTYDSSANKVVLDSLSPYWGGVSSSRWGNDTDGTPMIQANAPALKVPISAKDSHALIEPPERTDDKSLRREKLAYKALAPPSVSGFRGLYVKVDRAGHVSYRFQGGPAKSVTSSDVVNPTERGAKDRKGVYAITGDGGWVEVDNTWYDPRESKSHIRVVNIYMDQLLTRFPNTEVVYVSAEDSKGHLTPHLQDPSTPLVTVRIRNGNDISGAGRHGLSIATHRMAYVEGNFNVVNPVSALIASDNLTVLSNAWKDSGKRLKKPKAKDTTLHALFMVGGYNYDIPNPLRKSPGIHNLVRYRENWGRRNYNFEGSYLSLFSSKETLAMVSYYSPPNRNLTYDPKFALSSPPGMPLGLNSPQADWWTDACAWADVTSSSWNPEHPWR